MEFTLLFPIPKDTKKLHKNWSYYFWEKQKIKEMVTDGHGSQYDEHVGGPSITHVAYKLL